MLTITVDEKPLAMNLLFVDTCNSCQSIMAEAIFNQLAPAGWLAMSAGYQPVRGVHLRVISVFGRLGVPTHLLRPRTLAHVSLAQIDLVAHTHAVRYAVIPLIQDEPVGVERLLALANCHPVTA